MRCLYNDTIVREDLERIASDSKINWEKLCEKTVLVTGANGMLAYYTTLFLMYMNEVNKMNIHVIALVRNKEKAMVKFKNLLSAPNFKMLVQDVCEPIETDTDIDYIIHAAGAASAQVIRTNPISIINANVFGTSNICELAKSKKTKNILFLSTREVYGRVEGIQWISESDMGCLDPLDSRSCYPESKRMAEQILKSYNVQHGVPFVIARIAHSYGPGMQTENDGRVMADFMSDVIHGRNIVLKSEGTAERAFCYITDAVRGMFYALLNGETGESYNVANETESYMIRDVAKMMTESFPEKSITVKFEIQANDGGYCNYTRVGLDTSKLEKLGWKPSVRLIDGIMRTVETFLTEK